MDFFGFLEIFGVCVGLLYLYFEYNANIWLWATSIIMPAIYIFIYYNGGFYADFGLNVYYLVASIYGWIIWLRKKEKESDKSLIRKTPIKFILPLAIVSVTLFGIILFVLLKYTDSTVPYGDSFTTALSIVALWMLAQKFIEQWLVWVVVDFVSCYLYIYKELYPTAALYAIYSVIAVAGYFKWKKMVNQIQKRI